MAAVAVALVAVALVACAGAPPPGAARWPVVAGLDSEVAVLAAVERRLADLGAVAAAPVRLVVEPQLLLAYYRNGVIHMRPVFEAPAATEARLDRLLRGVFGDRAEVVYERMDGRTAAARAFAELGLLAIAHELFHHLRLAGRVGDAPIEPYEEERLAVELEVALLRTMIDEGTVDAGWLARYERLQRAIAAACPDYRPFAPLDEWQRSQHFDAIAEESFAALAAITRGAPNPAPAALVERTCLYAQLRVGAASEDRRWLPNVVETRLARTPR